MGKDKMVTGGTLPKVAKISYTPQTLAAAIAKNIRASRERRDLAQAWKQQQWGNIELSLAFASTLKIEAPKTVILSNDEKPQMYDCDTGVGSMRNWVAVECGSTACIAGWAASLSGDVMVLDETLVEDWRRDVENGWRDDTYQMPTDLVFSKDEGGIVHISDRARKLLDLDALEAGYCFSQERSEYEVLEYLDALATGKKVQDTWGWRHHKGQSYGRPFHEEIRGTYYTDDNGDSRVEHPNFDALCPICQVWDSVGRPSWYDRDDPNSGMPELYRRTHDVGLDVS